MGLNPSQFQLFDPGDPVPVDEPQGEKVDAFGEVLEQAPRLAAFTGQYQTAGISDDAWKGLARTNPFKAQRGFLDPPERQAGQGFYHGTAHTGLSEILPSKRAGHEGNYGISNPDVAYATKNDEIAAWAYAHNAASRATSLEPAAPVVYEVDPKGDDLRPDANAEKYGPDDWTISAQESPTGFNVRRELRMPAPGMTGDTIGLRGVQGRLFPVEGRWYQTTRQAVGAPLKLDRGAW